MELTSNHPASSMHLLWTSKGL